MNQRASYCRQEGRRREPMNTNRVVDKFKNLPLTPNFDCEHFSNNVCFFNRHVKRNCFTLFFVPSCEKGLVSHCFCTVM